MKVTYEFDLPDDRDDLKVHEIANDMMWALHEIHNKCRDVWKYEENPSEDRVKLAEEIEELIIDSKYHEVP